MSTAYVAFDTRSGRIVSVHYGAPSPHHARKSALARGKTSEEHIEILSVQGEEVRAGKKYKVDPKQKKLVETDSVAEGTGFGFGQTVRSASTPQLGGNS
jgi:hypothetical protein